MSLVRIRDSAEDARGNRNPGGQERVRDDRQATGIVDPRDRVPKREVGRHEPINAEAEEVALARGDLLASDELRAAAVEHAPQAIERGDRVVIRYDDDIERRGGEALDPIRQRSGSLKRVACGMDVDVDAPDDIVHVRRYVVLIAANDGALAPGVARLTGRDCPALARRCGTSRDRAEVMGSILGDAYVLEEATHAKGYGLVPDPVRQRGQL